MFFCKNLKYNSFIKIFFNILSLKYLLTLIFLFLLNFYSTFAQVDKEFWFAAPKETYGHGYLDAINNVSFKITNQSNLLTAHVEISMPANSLFKKRIITIPPSQTHVEVLATSWVQFDSIYANPSVYNAIPDSGKSNKGFLIQSDNDISVYYDYDNYWNRDLFSLKGSNALGTEFYAPLQNEWYNATTYNPKPFSSIDIIATEDNTVIDIYPTALLKGRTNNTPFTITLNKGQTYSLVAAGQGPADHPTGTRIVSRDPNKPIAVTVNDDSLGVNGWGCRDIAGDQIVPTSVIGLKYLVMTGTQTVQHNTTAPKDSTRGEQVIVTATQPGTVINFRDKSGNLLYTTTLGAGKTDYISPNLADTMQTCIYISATNPIYVFHITGIQCEIGGALLPPITDCTGSNEVSFFRSAIQNGTGELTLNLMIPYDKTIPFNAATQSYHFFTIHYQDGTTAPIDPTWFEPIDSAGWAVLRFSKRTISSSLIPYNQAVKITNDKDFFHLGITNGYTGITNKYGYFSSFNATKASAVVASVNETQTISCFGDTVFLSAKGGLEYTWHYGSSNGPPTYLSDPKSSTPQVFCPPGTHNFFVTVRQAKCFGDATLPITITVLPEVKASFETDKTTGCAPFNIKVSNTSRGGTRFEWSYRKDNDPSVIFTPPSQVNFNQPTVGSFQNITQPYKPILYTYKLKATYFNECPDTVTKQIVVYPTVKANFFPHDSVSCNPMNIVFRNMSSGNVADSLYNWNFGDGNSSPVKTPSHKYENLFRAVDTTYNVSLIASSPYYCRDTAKSTVTIHPFIKASFTVDTVKGCSPLTITAYNNCLNKPAINQYQWDFGDGTLRTDGKDTLKHTYPINFSKNPITYTLLLTVKNQYSTGCPDTISRKITVYPQTNIAFIANPNLNDICDSTLISFTTLTTPADTSFLWDFGDGNTTKIKDPQHLFTNLTTSDKTYTVKLTAFSNEYCNAYASKNIIVHAFLDPEVALDIPTSCAPFYANIKNKSRGGITKYEWVYGDGSHDFHQITDTVHLFRNTTNVVFAPLVKLVVTNSGGCKDSMSQRINVYPEIKADFTPSVILGCNPLPVTFTNKSTYLNQVAKYFLWQFGDSTSSTDKNPNHIFSNLNSTSTTFHVKLKVSSEYNCTADTTKDINVFPYLEAKFSVDSVKGCSPFPVYINNTSRGNISQYIWNYNDGNIDGHASTFYTHTYVNNSINNPSNIPLNRYLHLTVSNSNGLCKNSDSVLITVYPEVVAKLSADVTEGCNPLKVQFSNQSGPGAVPVAYDWSFGDGGTSTNTSTVHTFENLTSIEKSFKTKLRSYSNYRCFDSTSVTIKVYPFVRADFSFDNSSGCSPHTISINNSSSQGSNGFHWIFDDGQVSAVSAPIFNHIYRNLGSAPKTFTPMLIVDYNGQCQDTITQSLQVFPEVTATFTQDTLKGCHPLEISFTNQSVNANRYNWQFGDKGTSVVTSPKHTYTNFSNVDSIYNLALTASSIFNCKSVISKQVTIYAKPKALLDVENSVNCPPFLLPIQNLSEAGDFYYWSFGDGDSILSTNLSPISHTYDNLTSNTVSYDLRLFVQSVNNCTDEITQSINIYPRVIADFVPDTSGCSPIMVPMTNKSQRAISYKWDFGDKITSALRDPSHKFFNNSIDDTTFNIQMIGFSKFGCSDTAYRNVLVHPQPTVEFSALPSFLYFPDARVNIDNQTNLGNWNYFWNFDDGQSTTNIEPGTHEYLHWGNFNILLKAWSDYCIDSVIHRIRVFAPKTIADFDISPNGCVPLTASFTNQSTWATSYKWEFDDGSVSTEKNPNHIYQEPGKYQVKLTTYGDGAEDVAFREIEVFPKPEVAFHVSPQLVMLPNALVQAYNTSKLGFKYLWNFGDGDTAQSYEPAHVYKELGIFDITLNVWTEHQCFDSVVLQRAVKVEGTGRCDFPNAFKPNTDGPTGGSYDLKDTKNTVFHPYHDGVEQYKLEIYDRWGELLFESTDVNIGWDGYYKGDLCKSDVYIWKAKGKFYNGASFNKAGDVTLLR
jgi:gliding motility-associated-like protein